MIQHTARLSILLAFLPYVFTFTQDKSTVIVQRILENAPHVQKLESGRTELLVAVLFLDTKSGFAVGGIKETGTPAILLRTDNEAQSWTAIDTRLETRLYDIQFPTERVGYAVGLHGAVLKTEDRGLAWKRKPAPGDVWLASVFFTSENVGYAVGGSGDSLLLIKTEDGGESWQSLVRNVRKADRPRSLRRVRFLNDQTGFAVGDNGSILVTHDEGSSWTARASHVSTWLRTIAIPDSEHLFVGGTGVVLRSQDAGNTWQSLPSPSNEKVNDLAFVDTMSGYASTMDGRLWRTEDAGEHWRLLYDNRGKALNGFSLLSPSLGYLVGEGGTVLKIWR